MDNLIEKYNQIWQPYRDVLKKCYQMADLARFHAKEANEQAVIAGDMCALTAKHVLELTKSAKNAGLGLMLSAIVINHLSKRGDGEKGG